MRLTILGATGRTGRHLVEQALADDHDITAFVRTPSKLPIQSPRLTLVQGDVLDSEAVQRAVAGADAVVLAIGHTNGSPPNLLKTAAQNVVAAMQQHGVQRVVTEMGAGVPDPRDPGGLGPAFMRGVMKLVAGRLLADATAHVDVFRASDLDWTVVRPPRLPDGPRTGDTRIGYFAMGPGHSIARADVAAVMLELVASTDHMGEAPMITSS